MGKWQTVKLSDMFTLQMGKTPSRDNSAYWNGTHKWVSIADLGKVTKFIVDTKECITDLAVSETGIKATPKDTVVMSFKLSIGKTAVTAEEIYTNEAIMSFVDRGIYDFDIDYIYHLFSGKDWSEGTNKAVMGVTLNKATLSKISIPLPPLETQQQIAATLDKVTHTTDNAILEKLDLLVKSRFVEMFGDNKYPTVKTSDVCDFITKGTTPPANEIFEEYSENMIPYLKVYNLSFTGDLLFHQEPQFISKSTHNGKLSRSKVYPNDVLMNIVGPPLGKFSVVTNEYPEWNINQAIAIFRAKEKVIPQYLMSALMQPDVLRPFLEQAVGIRQLNLSLEQCRNLEISLPPLALQQQFAAFVEQTDKSKLAIKKVLEKAETLKKALMQKYFG